MSFPFAPFSAKQLQVLSWWLPGSPVYHCDGIIADGAIRSGKTLSMSLSFALWAMSCFNGQNFALCGKTIGSLRRNVTEQLKEMLVSRGCTVTEKRLDNLILVERGSRRNRFYLFGGKDESSADLIQGLTLAGVLFDEVALMPESFVNQATSRCSVAGSRYWFNCNPAGPLHWFKRRWLDRAEEKNLTHIHFTMADNLTLTPAIRERYERQYSGVFYRRYVLGEWISAEGRVYDMFDALSDPVWEEPPGIRNRAGVKHVISVDFGMKNATVFLDIYVQGDTAWVLDEYYHSGRETGVQKTAAQYARELFDFGGANARFVIVDPAAATFKQELKALGIRVKDGVNDVLAGIQLTASLFARKKIRIHRRCRRLIGELEGYLWDEAALEKGEERPVKLNDHAADALRYFAATMMGGTQHG